MVCKNCGGWMQERGVVFDYEARKVVSIIMGCECGNFDYKEVEEGEESTA